MDMSKTLQPRSALLFSKADRFELNLCQLLNRTGRYTSVRLFFKAISRLGDGVFWYTLALAMPLTMGARGLEAVGHMAITGLTCVLIYSQLKNRLVRQRPFISWDAINAHTAPLDLYSFPSGHTMNAVNFAVLFCVFAPALFWLVVPFAILVALSRVILGMHYPTDVLVGAALGLLISQLSLVIWPIGMFSGLL
ncbi:MAG: phosphatase PAP2 family protein [Oceanospirillaceae bacterium]|uniref:phosphatase PAP2 family protein n=1 Tax=unclassified Thalassolituus TaxID=2624967 RepID=UPI000C0B820B|nr:MULTISPECIES: phosphatase PAP2 family protein [unclassified Thalassolituus]MAK91456.1 phosphatase PAP2 family protein [Thalassolituus sp.]MAS23855.1 phosphatase PAP2 family protein [Oceanospirillaceae bacterium]MBL34413.1 phosphatase PAP2 family protein [Oceanospirillaceae bacterium]MBS54742.1 phosphatase PAP2 family protein [Oceanospirillaceae bacterium]|tara:strand:+ start:124 stop:705 length:582 start_codon:yes stop_codon:yes gene_type:complete